MAEEAKVETQGTTEEAKTEGKAARLAMWITGGVLAVLTAACCGTYLGKEWRSGNTAPSKK